MGLVACYNLGRGVVVSIGLAALPLTFPEVLSHDVLCQNEKKQS